jgi:hypothetical protein
MSVELKQYKPWFDGECLNFLDQRKHIKLLWLQDPHQSIVHNLNIVRREASRHFRNKQKEYPKAKIDELETNSKIKKISETCIGASVILKGLPAYEPPVQWVLGFSWG